MPEAPRPSPSPDGRVARNLFLEADPDLDALAHSTADEPARDAARRRRGRGLVILAAEHRSSDSSRAQDEDRFSPPTRSVGRLRAAASHAVRQADAAAGQLLRRPTARSCGALVTMVALAGLLAAFSWMVLTVGDASTARMRADGRAARTAATLRYAEARIDALTAQLHQLEQSATRAGASPASQDVPPPPAAPTQPTARPQHRHR
jgi:hypothetical protein